MSISFTRYVNITSGVAGSGAVRARELILRVFSSNPLIPANSFAEFTAASQVGTYFGTSSAEYLLSAQYFSFLSKNQTAPQKMAFASWVQTAVAPYAISDGTGVTLSALNAITAGQMALTLGAVTVTMTAINLSAAGTLAAVASALQTKIRAASADAQWVTATVVSNGNGTFTITGAVPGAGAIAVASVAGGPTVDVGLTMGFESVNAVFSQGSTAQSLTQTLIASTAASNNFAAFAFMPLIIGGTAYLSTAQITEIAVWNATQNNSFIFLPRVTSSTAAAISAALLQVYPGVGMTLAPLAAEYPELTPSMVLAATDYESGRPVSQNYMYQVVPGLTPSVTSDANADTYDALRVNYYGQTQNAGQLLSIYQRGVLTGNQNSPVDMNTYANEIWLKSSMSAAIMSLLLSLSQVSANATGKAQLLSICQSVVQRALANGVISSGNTLTQTQIVTITQLTNDPRAYFQIQGIGYWLNVTFPPATITSDGRSEYQANYQLVYKKNDAIRKVVGTDTLI